MLFGLKKIKKMLSDLGSRHHKIGDLNALLIANYRVIFVAIETGSIPQWGAI